jgi:hypothetical protein
VPTSSDRPDQPAGPDRPSGPTRPDPWAPPSARPATVATATRPVSPVTAKPLASPWWTPPDRPVPLHLLIGVGVVAAVGGWTLPLARPGIDVPLVAAALAGLVLEAAPRARDRTGHVFTGLAVALTTVAALRDSVWLVLLCLTAAVYLISTAALRARNWPAMLMSLPVICVAWALGGNWFADTARGLRRPRATMAWVRGGVLALTLAIVFGGLLTWADPVFAVAVSRLWPRLDLTMAPAQLFAFGILGCLAAGLVYGTASRTDWTRFARAPRSRPAAEWALPLAVVDVVLLAFAIVQAAVLFGTYPPSLKANGVTYSDWAKEGFWQLDAVTMLTVAVLGWAGRRADRASARHRRLLAPAGGALVVLTLGVVASALRRMWAYQDAYGWTVLRLCVTVFEIWLGGVLVLIAATWVLHRTSLVPRAVVTTAAVVLLGLGVAGPDALVASWDVDRYRHTHKIDTDYLKQLSDDAVPALACLPEPIRQQMLVDREPGRNPWYAVNLARSRAGTALRTAASGTLHC